MNRFFYGKNSDFKLSILKSKTLWIVLIIKLIACCLFASDYLTDLFYPFIDFFTNNDVNSTYSYFYNKGFSNSFPYPVLMLYITGCLKQLFSNDNILSFVDILLIRVPVLIADFSILLILSRWLKFNPKGVLIFYWANPILFYISYLHGQLDVIPTSFFMISLYFYLRIKWIYSSISIAFSILCKTNFIIALPFIFLYYIKSNTLNSFKLLSSILIFASIFFIIQIPVLSNIDYVNMVFNNAKQSQLIDLALVYNNTTNLSFILGTGSLIFDIFLWFNF